MAFRLKPGNVTAAIESLQKKWSQLLPGSAFEYKFMDESLNRLYAAEIRLTKAAQLALVLTIVIVMLGISGLISISIHKRTKEVGIRKVIGASAYNIIGLFVKEFLPVVFAGGLVSVPIAWYLMQSWLNHYATRVDVSPVPFTVSIGFISVIATCLITLQLFNISKENPVKNLKTE
jgi:ABC-type antimicrobial peptide transport system permease subunit